MKQILFVEPNFPIPAKSRNHYSFLPIGLLKLASYFRKRGYDIRLTRGNNIIKDFNPDKILITSLFTYWSNYVWDSVHFYKDRYPSSKVIVGGVYASLMPEHCKLSGCDEVFIGVHKSADKCKPAYDLLNIDYQIIRTTRGCIRRCSFCGAYKLEPNFSYKKSIRKEIFKERLVFYDDNILANPNIKEILHEIINLRIRDKRIICESQCGFDGRLLTVEIAKMLKKAGFRYPKIAWDGPLSSYKDAKKQIDTLVRSGYRRNDISVFMLYNWELSFKEMEKKRLKCWKWKVQISDCRYRPLNQTFDKYRPRRRQTNNDYHIQNGWTDEEVKQFRRNVRRQNISVRQNKLFYSEYLMRKRYLTKPTKYMDKWYPVNITWPKDDISAHSSNYFRICKII